MKHLGIDLTQHMGAAELCCWRGRPIDVWKLYAELRDEVWMDLEAAIEFEEVAV